MSRSKDNCVARSVLACTTALALIALSGCGGASSADETSSDVLRVATQQKPVQLDSCGASNGSELAYMNLIYAPLIHADPVTGELGPGLASSWEFSEDKLAITLELEPDLTFQDGTPIDGEAVAKSLTQCLEKGNQAPASMASITATGPTTIQIGLSEPDSSIPELLSGRLGMIASPTAREQKGEEFASAPVGAGPFELTGYEPGLSAEFTRWEDYAGLGTPAPSVEKIEWRILSDNSAFASEVAAGNVDFAWGFDTTLMAELASLPGVETGQNDLATGFTSINLNRSKPPLNDVRVRQAISHAIDRKSMAEAVSNGVWTEPAWGLYPKSNPLHDDSVVDAQPYDVDAAKALLAEAGYADGLAIKAVALDPYPYSDNALVLKDQLAKVGIDLQVEALPTAEATKSFYPNTDNVMLISALGGTSPLYSYPRLYGKESNTNVGHVDGPTTPLVDELLKTFDPQQQKEIMSEINTLAAEDVPFIGLYYIPTLMAWEDNVTGTEDSKAVQGNVNLAYLGLSS